VNRRAFLGLAAAPLVLGGSGAAALARTLGGTPVALVTADTESRVLAVEVATRRVLRSIATLPQPRSVEALPGLTGALVAHSEHGAITLLDGLRVRAVLEGFGEPRYTAIPRVARAQRASGLAYLTDSGRGELVTVDVRRARVVHRLELGGPARHVTLSPDGGSLWTALGSQASEIAVVDLASPHRPRRRGTIVPPWLAHDVVFAPDGATVWVTSGDRDEIAILPARGGSPRSLLRADRPPQHVAFREWGGRAGVAYVASGKDGTLRVQRVDSGRLVRTARIPVGSYNVTTSGAWVVSPSLDVGTLAVLTASGRPVARPTLARAAHDACLLVL
jgi:DNA-binding beta-propeller fold protein YncE